MADAGVLEVVEALDELDFEPECEGAVVDVCERPAKWTGVFVPCGEVVLVCDRCRKEYVRFLRRWVAECVGCDRRIEGIEWTRITGGGRG